MSTLYVGTTDYLSTGTLGSGVTFPSGFTLQTRGDTYVRVSGTTVSTSATRVLGTNLEVPITCGSTSNYLRISCFIPDVSNNGTASRALKVGFRYSTDSFSSSDVVLGDTEWLDVYGGYVTGALDPLNSYFEHSCYVETWVQVPVAGSEIKIQLSCQAITGEMNIGANSGCTYSLIISEIKA